MQEKNVKRNERENNNSLERYTITHTAVTNKHLHKTHSQLRVRMRVGKKQRKSQRDREAERQRDRETERQRDRETKMQKDLSQPEMQKCKKIKRQTESHREMQRGIVETIFHSE